MIPIHVSSHRFSTLLCFDAILQVAGRRVLFWLGENQVEGSGMAGRNPREFLGMFITDLTPVRGGIGIRAHNVSSFNFDTVNHRILGYPRSLPTLAQVVLRYSSNPRNLPWGKSAWAYFL